MESFAGANAIYLIVQTLCGRPVRGVAGSCRGLFCGMHPFVGKLSDQMSVSFLFLLTAFHETYWASGRVLFVLYAVELGAQPATIGILAAAFSVFPVLLGVQVGRLSDRIGARRPLIFAAVLGGAGALIPHFAPGLPALFVAAVTIGLFDGMFVVSVQSLVGRLSNQENRARNYSKYTLVSASAAFVGPLLAGFSIDHAGHLNSFLFLAALMLVPLVMLSMQRGAMRGGPRPAEHAKGGAMAMLADAGVRRVLATSSLMAAGSSLYQFYMPVYGHSIGMSATSIGFLLAIYAAATFIARLLLPSLVARLREERVLSFTVYIAAASFLLIPLFNDIAILALISSILGFALGCSGPVIMMLMFVYSGEGRSGEGLGLKITMNHLTKLVSPVVFGAMGSAFGLFPMFWINGLMIGAVGLLSGKKSGTAKSAKA